MLTSFRGTKLNPHEQIKSHRNNRNDRKATHNRSKNFRSFRSFRGTKKSISMSKQSPTEMQKDKDLAHFATVLERIRTLT